MIAGFAGSVHKRYEGSAFELMSEAAGGALEMAGLEAKDVDGLVTTFLPGVFDDRVYLHFFTNQVNQYLGLRVRYVDMLDFGGASALAMVHRACKAVRAGEAETVLCLIGGKASDVRGKGATVDSLDRASHGVSMTPFDQFFRVYEDLSPVSDYALVAKRHAKLFGTTDESRARVAVQQRSNARGNERAMYRDGLSVQDVLSSPVISDPLHLLEIVYPVDGFHAFVVSNRVPSAVEPLAYGEAHWPEMPSELPDIVRTPAAESSKRCGFDLRRVDAFELYDSFTITVMLQLEDIGLAEKGKAGEFVMKNDMTCGGDVPVNTGGGSLNCGQPAYMSGGILLEEALLQLNGMAKGHQVDSARTVFLNGIGGWNRSHSVSLVLGAKR